MKIRIDRVYLQNYKLFTEKEIVFGQTLSVFDGPNGYGKTSIFDAVEFLITGNISRIESSPILNGAYSYSNNCLAKDGKKDIIIKGKFSKDNGKNLIIALKIPCATGRINNPKNISVATKTYILDKYELPEEDWKEFEVNKEKSAEIRNDFFGVQNINFFTLIHYIHQEDRLAYFKKSESERTSAIEKLFGIENDIDKNNKLENAYKAINKNLNNVRSRVSALNAGLQNLPKSDINNVEYFELLGGKPKWDHKDIGFKGAESKGLYEQYQNQLESIKAIVDWKDVYLNDIAIRDFERIPEELRVSALRTWALDFKDSKALDKLASEKADLDFIIAQSELANQLRFRELNYVRICDILSIPDEKPRFENILEQIKKAEVDQTELQKSVESLKKFRQVLRKQTKSIEEWKDEQCPYCGQLWGSAQQLDYQFEETEKTIENSIAHENIVISKLLNDLQNLFTNKCFLKMFEFINLKGNDANLQLFKNFDSLKNLKTFIQRCKSILLRLHVTQEMLQYEDQNNYINFAESIKLKVGSLKNSISPEYLETCNTYSFDSIYKEYFYNNDYLTKIDITKIEQKKQYIQDKYFMSFESSVRELEKFIRQQQQLEELSSELKIYLDASKNALKIYREQVIKQIELPFFLYSSRLLQSYQAGQGVVISSNGTSVRFTCPGSEHDVLYTMSSGQLSAVLLSFSLALNKIYAGDIFQTILIDDPVQCMDDINMVSFVELLRLEFKDTQVVISTHEDLFSNFIQYKFDKYNQQGLSINLHG